MKRDERLSRVLKIISVSVGKKRFSIKLKVLPDYSQLLGLDLNLKRWVRACLCVWQIRRALKTESGETGDGLHISEPSLQKNRLAQRPFAACHPELLDRGCLLVVREVVHQRGNIRLEVLPSDLQQALVEQEASAAEMVKAVSRRMVPLLALNESLVKDAIGPAE